MPDHSPAFTPAAGVTWSASAPILGGQLLVVSGVNTVAPAVAPTPPGPVWHGRTQRQGEWVVVTRGGVLKLIASGTVTAADRVTGAAGGKVATGATNAVGTALGSVVDGLPVLVSWTAEGCPAELAPGWAARGKWPSLTARRCQLGFCQ